MRIPIRFTSCTAFIVALAAIGCAGDVETTDSAAGASVAESAPPLTPAMLAGTWNMRATPESGDTTATTYVLNAAADTTGWTITFPGGQPIPVRVRVEGDSVMTEAGPYDSVRRPGVKVQTNSVGRISGDSMTGTAVARYTTTGADSVVRLRFSGTRTP